MMDVRFSLRSLQQVIDKIPVDQPAPERIDIDFSKLSAPYHVKDIFKLSIEYEDMLPYEASCSIYTPKNKVTVVFIMNKGYEEAFREYKNGNLTVLDSCCLRRELYCHEICHLVAITRAYSSNRASKAREEFIERIKNKFSKSIEIAENKQAVPWDRDRDSVAVETRGISPSAFDKDHFRYDDDDLNYFRLYEELMLPEDKLEEAAKNLSIITKRKTLTYTDVAKETFASKNFFDLFPAKRDRLNQLIVEELNK